MIVYCLSFLFLMFIVYSFYVIIKIKAHILIGFLPPGGSS